MAVNRFAAGSLKPLLVSLLFGLVLVAGSSAPAVSGQVVSFRGGESPGTVVVRTRERRLYYVLDDNRAIRYVVGVGRAGQQWSGASYINGKHVRPAWSPPAVIRRANRSLPNVIPAGAPNNPMGAAALTLAHGEGEYAIHGTNRPSSVGGFVSFGCIRMTNRDIMDLFDRVRVGTPVIVTR